MKTDCSEEQLAAIRTCSGRYFKIEDDNWPSGTLYRQEASDGHNSGELYMWKHEPTTGSCYFIGVVPSADMEDNVLCWVSGWRGYPDGKLNWPYYLAAEACTWQKDHIGTPHCI